MLEESRRLEDPSGAFYPHVFKSPYTAHELELTWLRDWDRPYNLGDNEFHLAFYVDDYEAALKSIKKWALLLMRMLIWVFISCRSDGYWTEIIPAGKY